MKDEKIPYYAPHGTIHDLAHLAELCDSACRILCVSDRTLYVLQNLVNFDATFRARYAVELLEKGFIPVTEDSPLWPLYRSTVAALPLEVRDMSCDIESGLNAIADALSELAARPSGGPCADYGGGTIVVNCLSNADNETLLGPDESSVGYGVPPDGFATWEEYLTYKCQAAEFIHALVRKFMVAAWNFDLVFLTANLVAPVIAGIAGVLPAVFTPAGFAIFITAIVGISALAIAQWFFMGEMIDQWDLDHDAIVCALYNSGSSVQAISALSNALEDAIQAIVSWGALGGVSGQISALLSTAFSQLAGNGIVEPLFKAVVAATAYEADCSGCGGYTGALAQTRLMSPYNQLVVGDSIASYSDNPTTGYRGQNSGVEVDLEFTPPDTVTEYELYFEFGYTGPAPTNMVLHIQKWTGSQWIDVRQYGPTVQANGAFVAYSYTEQAYTMNGSQLHRIHASPQDYNEFGDYRKILLLAT
jgi:hypothetical protein